MRVAGSWRRLFKLGLAGGGATMALLQIFPASRLGIHVEEIGVNPPERFALDAPPEVLAVLHRACWDCHSHETRWPFYAHLAPCSWLIAHDIHNARRHLNFSTWGGVDEDERRADRRDCWEQIQAGAMPPRFYVFPLHPEARLSAADKGILEAWLTRDAGPSGR
jgi:hypothetical protein